LRRMMQLALVVASGGLLALLVFQVLSRLGY
jgi:hypothetical protein